MYKKKRNIINIYTLFSKKETAPQSANVTPILDTITRENGTQLRLGSISANLEGRQVAILKFQQRTEGNCELIEWVFSLFCGRNFDVNTT